MFTVKQRKEIGENIFVVHIKNLVNDCQSGSFLV